MIFSQSNLKMKLTDKIHWIWSSLEGYKYHTDEIGMSNKIANDLN